jgi:hypothetical protein
MSSLVTWEAHMPRLMLLIFVGFVLGFTGGWMNPADISLSHSFAAPLDIALASGFRAEPLSTTTVFPGEPPEVPEIVSQPPGSGHAARKRRQLRTKLAAALAKPVARRALPRFVARDDDEC